VIACVLLLSLCGWGLHAADAADPHTLSPFPTQYYSIVTHTDDSTNLVKSSGRVYYDFKNRKMRVEEKHEHELRIVISRYDLGVEWHITEDSHHTTCLKMKIHASVTMPRPLDLTQAHVYRGEKIEWGTPCYHWQVVNLTDSRFFDFYVDIDKGLPFQLKPTHERHTRLNWLFFTSGAVDAENFELPASIQEC